MIQEYQTLQGTSWVSLFCFSFISLARGRESAIACHVSCLGYASWKSRRQQQKS